MKILFKILHIFLYWLLIIKNSLECNEKEEELQINRSSEIESAEFKLEKNATDAEDEVMIEMYKAYLISPEKMNQLDIVFDAQNTLISADQKAIVMFKIEASNWYLKELALELLKLAFEMENNAKKLSKKEREGKQPQLSKEMLKKTKELIIGTIQKLVEEHGQVEEKCAKMERSTIGKKKTLCYHYNFLARIVGQVDKWTTDKWAWAKIGHEKRIEELVKIMAQHSWPNALDWIDKMCFSTNFSHNTSLKLIDNKQKMRIIHAENVKKMIKRMSIFRDFLCKNTTDFGTNIKPLLEQMVGTAELMRLEDQFPGILRIEIISRSSLVEGYRQILSSINFKMLMRKYMVTLIEIMRETENYFKKQNAKNENLQKIFTRKMNEILKKAFANLYSPKGICVMIKFIRFTQSKRAKKQLETELKKWETNQCETEQQQVETMEEFVQKEFSKRIKEEILALLEAGGEDRAQMLQILAKDGAKSVLIELIGWKWFKELDDGGHLVEIFPSKNYKIDERLWEHYSEAVTHMNISRNKLMADLIAFLRWIHNELIDALNLKILWSQLNKCFEIEYDKLFVEEDDLTKLLQINKKLEEMILETKNFINKEIVENQPIKVTEFMEEQLKNKWEKKMDKCKTNGTPKMGQRKKEKKEFLKNLHQMQLFILFRRNEDYKRIYEASLIYNFHYWDLFIDANEFRKKWEQTLETNNQKKGINLVLKKKESDKTNVFEQIVNEQSENQINGCPDKNKKAKELAAIDRTNFVEEELMSKLLEYFKLENDSLQKTDERNKCHPIELDILTWNYAYFLETLNNFQNFKQFDDGIFNEKNSEIKLCRIYICFEYLTKRYNEREYSKSQKEAFVYAEFVDEQMLSAQNDDQFFVWLKRKCSNEDQLFVANVVDRLCSNRWQMENISFIAFLNLLENSMQFRAYFCKLPGGAQNDGGRSAKIYDSKILSDDGWKEMSIKVQKVGKVKDKVLKLVGDENLLRLEEQFPEVLQIDVVLIAPQLFIYENILKHKSNSVEVKFWTARLGISLLMQKIATLISTSNHSDSLDNEIKFLMIQKRGQIIRDAFSHFSRQKFYGGMGTTLCSLVQLEKYLKKSIQIFEVNDQISASTLAKWVPKCATEEAQNKAYQQMKTNCAKENGNALRILIQNNEKFKKNVRNTQGARTRIEKLLDNAEEFKTLMHFCENDIRNEEVFTDEWLMNWYLTFLNNFQTMDPPERFAYVLFLSYSVFIRWMDHQTDPANVNLPFGLRQIYEQIWKGERIKLEQFANEKIIKENTWDELMYIYSLITEVFEKIKEFVEKKRNEKNLGKIGIEIAKRNAKNSPLRQKNEQKEHIERNGKLLAEWREIWTKGEQMAQQFTMESIKTEWLLTEWIQTLHFDALSDLMERKGMRSQLEMGIQKHRNWLTLFMDEGKVGRIQKMTQLNDEEFAEMRKNQKNKKERKREESEEQKKYEENFEKLQKEWEEKEEEEAKQKKKEKEKVGKEKKKAKGQNMNKIKKKKSGKTPKRADKSSEEMNLANQKISEGTEESEGKKWEESEKSSEMFNNWGPSAATEETATTETIGQPKNRNTNENDANAIEIGEREEEDGLENAMAHICLNDFLNEDYLMTTYQKFLEEPNDFDRKILDIGIYFYEISNRILAEKEMKKVIYIFEKNEHEIIYQEEKLKEIEQKWGSILQKNEMKTAKMGRNERQKMKENLQNLLKEIIFVTEGIENEKTKERKMDKKEEEKEIKNTKYQMHRNNLANVIAQSAKGKSGQIWAQWDEQRRTEVLMMLFEKDTKKRTTANLISQFGTHLEGWHKMQEQQQIDQFSINEHKIYVKNKMKNHVDGIDAEQIDNLHSFLLPQLNQQIFFNENNDENQIKKLEQILIENRYIVPMDSNKALDELRIIALNWSQGEAKLLQIGSMLLGTNTATSDIDIICIVPQKSTKTEAINQFFGIFKCDLAQRKCEGNSFYCILCLNEKVGFLQKFPKAYIPLIEMNFLGIKFDILFVAIPTINALPDEPMTQSDVMALMQILANQTEPDEKMIKSLAGHASNGHIKRILGRKMFQKFRKIVASLKFWAKSNYIYGTQFGFFNGISLSIMATKVSLLYPNASVPFLLNRFFLIFASWDWPVPLRLAKYVPNEFQIFSWTPKDEEEKRNSSLLMPIITPGYLEQNGMYQMNKSTFKIVQKSMREAFLKVRQIQSLADDQNWIHLFPLTKFTKKYKHYAAVCCIVTNLIHLDQFCDFVERRIRLQLLHFDDVTDQVNFTHIKAENEGKFECPNSILMPVLEQNRTFSMHKAWLLGIELKDEIAQNIYKSAEDGQKEELIKSLNLNLSEEFDKIILGDYSKKLNGLFQLIALHSKYVDGTELEKAVSTN